jgi:O-antigen/teichoic acid export membrane protein
LAEEPAKVVINRQVLVNTISNYIGKSINIVAWFFLTPFILGQLGPSLYGLWVLIGSLVAYSSLLDLGIAGAVTKYVAEFHAKGQNKVARNMVATALGIYLLIGIFVIVLSVSLAPFIVSLFRIELEHRELARWLVVLSGVGVGISIPSKIFPATIRGLQRFDLINLIVTIHTILLVIGTVAVLLAGGGVIGLVLVGIFTNVLIQGPNIYILYKVAPELKLGYKDFNPRLIRTVGTFSSSLFLINLGGHLESKTDEVVIGAFLPVMAITPYNLARKLSALPQTLTEQFLSLLLPMASKLHAENDQIRLSSLFITSSRITLGIYLPVGIFLMLLAPNILGVWVGEEYSQYAYLVIILTLASLIDTSTWPAGFMLQGMAKHKVLAILTIASGVFNLALSLILLQYLGLLGVALGTIIPTTIICIGFVLPYAIRYLKISFHQILSDVFLPALAPAIPTGVMVLIFRQILPQFSWLSLGILLLISIATYFIGYISLEINIVERQAFKGFLVNLLRYTRYHPKSS